ncbi:hypothetical protein CCACVL1_00275 [Corchorus capsularis]|uniref:Uncharacterized protein n=1 Tax=Corchorus capsularis TaxID=210143 RepID=A0A1R3KXH2_COCAP|nr:hypothetical protein CCACVL1_00275 [Corchorus capsularis]
MSRQGGPTEGASGSKTLGNTDLGQVSAQGNPLATGSTPIQVGSFNLDWVVTILTGLGRDFRGGLNYAASEVSGSKREKPTVNDDFGPDIYSVPATESRDREAGMGTDFARLVDGSGAIASGAGVDGSINGIVDARLGATSDTLDAAKGSTDRV